jgi:plasmid stabilization system protein ParE
VVDHRRQVAWTRAALDCLDEILETIAADAPGAALRVLGLIDNTAESLSEQATCSARGSCASWARSSR